MLTLNDEQLKFLNDEFNVREDEIENMTKDEWKTIRLRSYDIMLDEMLDDEDNAVKEVPERGLIAESIVNTKYSKLKNAS